MAESNAQKKTVPFPQPKDGMPKDIPTVNMTHPLAPMIERFAVPALFFVSGVVVSRIFWPRTKHVTFKGE